MSEQHTPEPWVVSDRYEALVMNADGRSIANCGGFSSNVNSDQIRAENYANARLIADAPRLKRVNAAMYEALKECRAFFALEPDDQYECAGQLEMKVRAALASAEHQETET